MEFGPFKKYLLSLAFFIPLLAYSLTMPTDLTLGVFGADSGELITASVTDGITHPTGYPTWLIISKLFAYLPIGRNLAHRYNLFSALCMSLAMLTLAYGSDRFLQSKWPVVSLSAVLGVAFTLTVWSQAVITEVYALNSLMVSMVILLLVKIDNSQPSNRLIVGLGAAVGVAMTTHLTSALLLPAVGLMVLFATPYRHLFKTAAIGSIGFLIGLTPYLFLFLRANSTSPVIWGDTSTVAGWWWLVSGEVYRANLQTLSTADIIARIPSVLWAEPIQLVVLLLPIGAIAGLYLIFTNRLNEANDRQVLMNGYKLPAVLLLTAILYTLYALNYSTNDWRVFLLPACLCLVIPLSAGLAKLDGWSISLPLLLIALNLPVILASRTDSIRADGESVFSQLPENAIVLTDGRDETLFPMWYFRYAENQRPDTIVVDQNMFAFDWYRQNLTRQNPGLQATEFDDLAAFRQQNYQTRPICEVSLHPIALHCPDG